MSEYWQGLVRGAKREREHHALANGGCVPKPAYDELATEHARLRHNYGLLLQAHARVQMDTPEDKALHARVIETFTEALRPAP